MNVLIYRSLAWPAETAMSKLWRWIWLGHDQSYQCQTLHAGSAYWASSVYTNFSDLNLILRSQWCQTVETDIVIWVQFLTSFMTVLSHYERCTNYKTNDHLFVLWWKIVWPLPLSCVTSNTCVHLLSLFSLWKSFKAVVGRPWENTYSFFMFQSFQAVSVFTWVSRTLARLVHNTAGWHQTAYLGIGTSRTGVKPKLFVGVKVFGWMFQTLFQLFFGEAILPDTVQTFLSLLIQLISHFSFPWIGVGIWPATYSIVQS